MLKRLFCLLFLSAGMALFAQTPPDSSIRESKKRLDKHEKLFESILDSIRKIQIQVGQKEEDLELSGTRIVSNEEKSAEAPKLTVGGYISAYYALYSDSADKNNFQKFPTTAPQSNVFSLNLAQITTKYSSKSLRAITTLHFGDMPRSIWSRPYNMIQEANAGIRLLKRVWLDAGFFRTHIGVESIQPRENITSGVAIVTFFEPYYLAGAKLSFLLNDKLTLQLNSFNSYNSFVETNRKKAVGFSLTYDASQKLSFTFNSLWNDDSPDSSHVTHRRLYNNAYVIYKSGRFNLGAEVNFCFQQNTSLNGNVRQAAYMYSGLVSARYMLVKRFYLYGRLEYFSDPNEILTGPEVNENRKLIGLDIGGATLGVEYKPLPNAYLRLEGRALETQGGDEKIFLLNGQSSATRYEMIASLGVWF